MGKSESDFGKTVILVGHRGTGKSATGNSIIGADVFDSMNGSWGITVTAQMHTTVLPDGQILNVIDTPGLFGSSVEEKKTIGNEIAKCIRKAKSGIRAVLGVVSLASNLSEEASAIVSLKQFFGGKIGDYMILVFTWGDVLGERPLDTYLARYSSESWEKIIRECGGRYVVFDNVTNDEVKKSQQVEELLRLVDTVVDNNDGVPYTNELFVDPPDVSGNGLNKAIEEQMNGFLEKIESKLREIALMLEKQLAEERIARMELSNEMSRMMLDLERAQKDAETAQKLNKENEWWHERFSEMHRETTQRLEKQLAYEKASRLYAEAKAQAAPLKSNDEIINLREDLKRAQKLQDAHKEPMDEMSQKVEELLESVRLEKQLATEQVARQQTEAKVEEAQRKSNYEISKLREDLERAQRDAEELRKSKTEMEEKFKKIRGLMDEENQNKFANSGKESRNRASDERVA